MGMSEEEIKAISQDVRDLKEKVEDMSTMLQELLENYTDECFELRDDYLKRVEEIRKEKGKTFNSIEEFDEYFELNEPV